MDLPPHYRQVGASAAISGAGFGVFGCDCGKSVLIAGYEPRNFLGIAIQCAACGQIAQTPGLPTGAPPPQAVTVIERGADHPPAIISQDTILIGRDEVERLAALCQPRSTDADPHVISDALLDDVEFQQRRHTGEPLNLSAPTFRDHALAWAVAHFRGRLRDPDWTSFIDNTDLVAVTVIAAFRDLFASWVHHPLFGAMIATAAAKGFSLHAMAMFGAAKSLASSGNRVTFVATTDARPRIVSFQMILGSADEMTVVVNQFDRFEWPNGGRATPQAIRAAVIDAMTEAQGTVNRRHPGMLILSGGASEGPFDQMLIESIGAALASHGKRHRGLAAVAAIFPKVGITGKHREARFGYVFYPIPNRSHAAGTDIRIGTRADYTGLR